MSQAVYMSIGLVVVIIIFIIIFFVMKAKKEDDENTPVTNKTSIEVDNDEIDKFITEIENMKK